jgi:hypothetical protein
MAKCVVGRIVASIVILLFLIVSIPTRALACELSCLCMDEAFKKISDFSDPHYYTFLADLRINSIEMPSTKKMIYDGISQNLFSLQQVKASLARGFKQNGCTSIKFLLNDNTTYSDDINFLPNQNNPNKLSFLIFSHEDPQLKFLTLYQWVESKKLFVRITRTHKKIMISDQYTVGFVHVSYAILDAVSDHAIEPESFMTDEIKRIKSKR